MCVLEGAKFYNREVLYNGESSGLKTTPPLLAQLQPCSETLFGTLETTLHLLA